MKAIKQKLLVNVTPEKNFWCRDGRILSNLVDLEKALKEMGDEIYKYHVSKDKNDFAKWVGEVIGDKMLAQELIKTKNKEGAAEKVQTRIKSLQKNK